MSRAEYFQGYSGCGPLPPQVVAALPNAEEIAAELARTVFASTWGDLIESAHTAAHYPEREESERSKAPAGFDLPNLSGCDLMECAPFDSMPPRFLAYARDAVACAVALAWAKRRGAETLERWADCDAAALGHALALEFMGTGAADREEIGEEIADDLPTRDCDGRIYLDFSEIMERPDSPTDAELATLAPRPLRLLDPFDIRNAEPSDAQRGELVAALRDALDNGGHGREILETCADLLRARVESVELIDGTRLAYVNLGDTYADTLTWDGTRIGFGSWGAALEHAEEAHTYASGETRCGYCGEWARDLDARACPECGHGPD